MKKLCTIIVAVIITAVLFGQAPSSFKYQAVLRDGSGNVKANTDVSIDIAILQGSATGTQVFIENHVVTANEFGLVNLEIGSKNPTGFSDIDWSAGPYFVKISVDNIEMGTSQLLSVPYALYAKTAENGFSGDYNDLTNTPTLFSGSYNDLTDKPALFDGSWTSLTGKPTTLTGYGITDAMSTSHAANGITFTNITNWNTAFGWGNHSGLYRPVSYVPAWNEITSKPTTIAGFGLTDAVSTSGNQTIGGNKTFTGTINASNKVITDVANPINLTDAANKAYVDEIKETIYNELLDAGMNGIVKDIEGNSYKTIKIGDQVWMAENLAYLPAVSPASSGSATLPKYYVYGYNGSNVSEAKSSANYKIYGVLYNWPAAMNGAESSSNNPSGVQGVCPSGWHLPSDAEWTELIDYLGGAALAGGKLKETGIIHWTSPNTGASNESGFTGLAGGYRWLDENFTNIGVYGDWWSTTQNDETHAWDRHLYYENQDVSRSINYKGDGFSVRCIKD